MTKPDKIEKRCYCGTCRRECYNGVWKWWDRSCLNSIRQARTHCPGCGWFLDDETGFAYRMQEVKSDREQAGFIIEWLDKHIAPAMNARHTISELDEVCEYLTDFIQGGEYMGVFKPEESTNDYAGEDAAQAE